MTDVLLQDAELGWIWHITSLVTIMSIAFAVVVVAVIPRTSDPLGHLHRYEVVKDGTLEHQFPTAEALLRYAYPKVGLTSSAENERRVSSQIDTAIAS
jgi:hypothetical protein